MSLHACRDCTNPVSSQAARCPQCGAPNPAWLPPKEGLFARYRTEWLITAVLVASAGVWHFASSQSKKAVAEQRAAAAVPAAPDWQASPQLVDMAGTYLRLQGLYCPTATTMKEHPVKGSPNAPVFRVACAGDRGEIWYELTTTSRYEPLFAQEM